MNAASQPFKIETADSSSGARILRPIGALTLQSLFDFQDVARQQAGKSVILDLEGVPFMDSAGLGSVISIFTSCQRSSRKFAIIGLSERIRTLFEITHVDSILPCYATLADAEAAV